MRKKLSLLLPLLFLVTSCQINFEFNSSSSSSSYTSSQSSSESSESSMPSSSEDSTSSSSEESSTPKEEWSLSWSDEFEGDTLNTSNWSYMYGDGSSYGVYRWGNDEKQYYKSENVSLRDGSLVITAKKEQAEGYEYTSARLRTAGKVSTTYGKVEARIALPAVEGMWPAFWMLPESKLDGQGWPHSGEIDIMEAKGRLPNTTSGALHYANDNNTHTYRSGNNVFKLNNYTNITEFHTYGIIWNEEKIEWYCDEVVFLTVTKEQWHTDAYSNNDAAPFNKPFHILLNLAVLGNFDPPAQIPANFTSAEMEVDYVRIYTHNDI